MPLALEVPFSLSLRIASILLIRLTPLLLLQLLSGRRVAHVDNVVRKLPFVR